MSNNLQELIERARNYQMSREEKRAQLESFAYGNTHMENAKITRADIREARNTIAQAAALTTD